ncbi:MAG: hypothetical protein WC916_06350 [Candidatus Woesearchaeota archaeon]
MNDLVHIRLDTKMRNEIARTIKHTMHANESEFIRDALRKQLETYQKIELLTSLKNTLPRGKGNATRSQLFREFGLE